MKTIEHISQLLPHRDPILMPHGFEVVAGDDGHVGVAHVALSGSKRLLGYATQVDCAQELMLESAAQALGLLLSETMPAEGVAGKDEKHLLLGFNDVQFDIAALRPEQPFMVRVRRTESSGSTHAAAFEVHQDDRQLARGALLVMKG